MARSGFAISRLGSQIATRFALASGLVGALPTAVATSLPELVATLTAIRRGALQLALGGIFGGNTFDTLFLVAPDAAHRDGSILHAMTGRDLHWPATGLLTTAALLAGLIVRERAGPARIGVESVLLIAIYAVALGVQLVA